MTRFMNELIEILAGIEHERWGHWQKYLHSCCDENEDGSLTIPKDLVDRWTNQIGTPYSELSEKEKQSDRNEVFRTLTGIQERHRIVPID